MNFSEEAKVFKTYVQFKLLLTCFLGNHMRSLKEAANVWLLGDGWRWIMKFIHRLV